MLYCTLTWVKHKAQAQLQRLEALLLELCSLTSGGFLIALLLTLELVALVRSEHVVPPPERRRVAAVEAFVMMIVL